LNCGYDDNHPYGLLYQWGRKDGGGYNILEGRQTAYTGPIYASSEQSKYFYTVAEVAPKDWLITQNDKRWNSGSEESPVKTVYDPCPEGWRVPTKTELNRLRGNHTSGNVQIGTHGTFTQNGYYFDGSTNTTPDSGVFLPVGGVRSYKGTSSDREVCSEYWSSSVNNVGVYSLQLHYLSIKVTTNYRAQGFPVRCVHV